MIAAREGPMDAIKLRDLSGGLERAERLARLPNGDPLRDVGRAWLRHEGDATREEIARLKARRAPARPGVPEAFVDAERARLDAALEASDLRVLDARYDVIEAGERAGLSTPKAIGAAQAIERAVEAGGPALENNPLARHLAQQTREHLRVRAARDRLLEAAVGKADASQAPAVTAPFEGVIKAAFDAELEAVECRVGDGRADVIEGREAAGVSTPKAVGAAQAIERAVEAGEPIPEDDPAARFFAEQLRERRRLADARDRLLEMEKRGLVFRDEAALRRRQEKVDRLEREEAASEPIAETAWSAAARSWEAFATRKRGMATLLRAGMTETAFDAERARIDAELEAVECRVGDGRADVIEGREAAGVSTPKAVGAAQAIERAVEAGTPIPEDDPAARFFAARLRERRRLFDARDRLLEMDERGLVFPNEAVLRRRREKADEIDREEQDAWARIVSVVPAPEARLTSEIGRATVAAMLRARHAAPSPEKPRPARRRRRGMELE